MSSLGDKPFLPVGFWAPRRFLQTLLRPRLWHSVLYAPVSVRLTPESFLPVARWPTLTEWSYDSRKHGGRICVAFSSRYGFELYALRWRTIANALWKLISRQPSISFTGIRVDIGDCEDSSVPPDTFRFAKLPDDPHDLIPNAHLLGSRRRLPLASRWEEKADSIYFRGAMTGPASWDNPRIAACLAASQIRGGDCKLTSYSQVQPAFVAQLMAANLTGAPDSPAAMNRHRYLLDIDGNTSSWDRFWMIGTLGGVPVRFENRWQEFWHSSMRAGEHYIDADRHSLPHVIEDLRGRPSVTHAICAAAAEFVRSRLSSTAIQSAFETAWLSRVDT